MLNNVEIDYRSIQMSVDIELCVRIHLSLNQILTFEEFIKILSY